MDTGCKNPMCRHYGDGAESICEVCEATLYSVYTMGYLAGVEDAMKHLCKAKMERN